MARIEAVAKALYYPTPQRVMQMLAERIPMVATGEAILDPCAGTGEAVATLAAAWNMRAYGIELHAERAAEAAKRLTWARCGSYHQIQLGKPNLDPFSVLFLNPPYDDETDERGVRSRQEVEFLRATLPMLSAGGLLIFIPPRKILRDPAFLEVMRRGCTDIVAYRFPSEGAWFDSLSSSEQVSMTCYDQVVVLAQRAYGGNGYYRNDADTSALEVDELPSLDTLKEYKPGNTWCRNVVIDLVGDAPESYAPGDGGAWLAPAWLAHVAPRSTRDLAPLVAPRPGHQAMLLAAGALNGLELATEAGPVLVKGGSRKVTTTTTDGKERTERERIAAYLSVLDLTTGAMESWQADDDLERTARWFQAHGPALAAGIRAAHQPQFDGVVGPEIARLRAPGILPGRSAPEILDVQREAAAAVAYRWRRHKAAILCGEMGTGKEQPVDEPVLTPGGWVAIGQLRVGDLVVDPTTGGTTDVVGVYPQGRKPVFRCIFTDGTSTRCGAEHLWEVNTAMRKWRGSAPRVLPLKVISQRLRADNGNLLHFIPLTAPVAHAFTVLPVAPYTMGALLGDGCLQSNEASISSADPELLARVQSEIPGCVLRHRGGYDYRIGSAPGLMTALRDMQLLGKRSWEKHIPDAYMRGSVAQRTALLQGLLDTDGSASEGSASIEYSTTSPMLAAGVVELVQSLGGTATTAERVTHYTHRGERRAGRLSYRVMIALPNEIQPFCLKRKLERVPQRTKYQPTRAFQEVTADGEAECVCIKVANPRGLYVTRGHIVTHNTTMAVVAAELAHTRKAVVVCPTHLVRKWVREIDTITGRRCARVARCLADIDTFFTDANAHYLVLSKETAKLGARWVPATSTGTQMVRYERLPSEARRRRACPSCGKDAPRADAKVQQRCEGCGGALWQYAPISTRGTKRWPLASYLHARYARRYTLIVDEAHQHAKADTDQARAVHQLIVAATRVLMMTGTLYGGRASSLFYLLHRLDPNFRDAYGYQDCATYVQHHGLFERVYKEDERSSTYGYRKGNSGGRVREIPGMSPAMIPLLLPFTVFVKLRDLRLELPPYREEVLLVDPAPEVASALEKFTSRVKKELRKHPRAVSAYLQAALGYPDRADQAEAVHGIAEDGSQGPLLARLPSLDVDYAKDDALVDLATEERAAGRKVLVFVTQPERRDVRPRLRARLEAAGLRVVQLESSVAPEDREAWMATQVEAGFDVMLTNGRLVETGLDLMFASTIVQFGVEYSLSTLRQSIRRSWRLGQTQPIRVIFMAYRRTMQATATTLTARKMNAAELVDGDELGGLAQHDTGGGDLLTELAREALAA